MTAKATFKYLRISPRKLRLVVDPIRGKSVQNAIDLLAFNKKPAARDVTKLVKSAVANAMQAGGSRVDRLFIKAIYVDVAPTLKRFLPRARGGASSIYKRMSHVTVELGENI